MDTDLLEPKLAYERIYKEKHHNNTIKYFDTLVKKSNIDIEANKQTVKEYKAVLELLNQLKNNFSGKKGLRTFLIVLIVISFIAAAILVLVGVNGNIPLWAGILGAVGAVALAVGLIIIIVKVLNGSINRLKEEIDNNNHERDKLYELAWNQMSPLNKLFDWNIPAKIVNMDTDLIKMDVNFDGQVTSYKNNFFTMGDMLVPGSMLVEGMLLGMGKA